jgi:5'-3' exonuclease
MISSLGGIKGVGPKVKSDLIKYYGSEAEAIQSLENQEFERLLEAGVGFQKAVEISKHVFSRIHDFSYANNLKTKEAKEIYNAIFSKIKGYPRTDFAKISIHLFQPTLNVKELSRRFEFIQQSMELTNGLEERRREIGDLLKRVSKIRVEEPRLNDVIAVEDPELYEKLSEKLPRGNIILVESAEELEFLRDFEFVRYLQSNAKYSSQAMELSNVEPVYEEELELIAPEIILSFYGLNKESIIASQEFCSKGCSNN